MRMSSKAFVRVDESRFPLVDVTFSGTISDEEFRDYLKQMTDLVTRGKRNVVIIDATKAGRTPPVQRKLQEEWLDRHRAELEKSSLGTAFVITSPMVRGLLTAIFWLTTMPSEHVVVGSYEEAERWAFERLRSVGIEPPAPRGTP